LGNEWKTSKEWEADMEMLLWIQNIKQKQATLVQIMSFDLLLFHLLNFV